MSAKKQSRKSASAAAKPALAEPERPPRTAPDPLGKRALYGTRSNPKSGRDEVAGSVSPSLGKRALFSAAEPKEVGGPGVDAARSADGGAGSAAGAAGSADGGAGSADGAGGVEAMVGRGPVTVECQRCRVVSHIGFLDLLIHQLPVGYWFPRPKFDHRMTCPACSHRVWASVTIRPLLARITRGR